MADKYIIWSNIGNVKKYNDNQLSDNTKVFVNMTHYPPKLQRDKASLMPKFRKYRERRSKPKWSYNRKNGELCLKVGGRFIRPLTDNFGFKMLQVNCDVGIVSDAVESYHGASESED